jgi:hypothetical protein
MQKKDYEPEEAPMLAFNARMHEICGCMKGWGVGGGRGRRVYTVGRAKAVKSLRQWV